MMHKREDIMANIDYTHILNAYVSTEGSNGFMTNYIYYSVLVVFDDGTCEIVEGKRDAISRLLRYLRTPQDSLRNIEQSLVGLRNDINTIIDQKMQYVIESLYPIPDLKNAAQQDAVRLLQEAGFTPSFVHPYPPSTPPNGYVRSYQRSKTDFKKVELDIIHPLPDVKGLSLDDAVAILEKAGFSVQVKREMITCSQDVQDNHVIQCSRSQDESLDAVLAVASVVPQVEGLSMDEAKQILKAYNFEYEYTRMYSALPIDTVIGCRNLRAGAVQLILSQGKNKYTCPHVGMTWSALSDSEQDTYSASAEYTVSTKQLAFSLNYHCKVKSKHKITDVTAEINGKKIIAHVQSGCSCLIDVYPDMLNFSLPLTYLEPPKSAVIHIETQYGLMKKTEDITLNCTFRWE